MGIGFRAYCTTAAEIGRYCGATALTWNMHVCSTLWSGPLADDLDMDAATRAEHERRRAVHYKRIIEDGAIYSQPFSEGGAAAAGGVAFGTEASLFQKSGNIPAVVCGPGNIAQAHKPDEYIKLSEIAKCEAFMRNLLDRITAASLY